MEYNEEFKKGDKVKIISGPYRGETGKIVEVGWDEYRVLLDKGVYVDVGPSVLETSIVKIPKKKVVSVRGYMRKKTIKVPYSKIKPFTSHLAYYKNKLYLTKEDLKRFPEKVTLLVAVKDINAPLTVWQLGEIGKKEGLSGRTLTNFVKFFRKRFPKENDAGYAQEWASRFRRGVEWLYADKKSKQVLLKINPSKYKSFRVK